MPGVLSSRFSGRAEHHERGFDFPPALRRLSAHPILNVKALEIAEVANVCGHKNESVHARGGRNLSISEGANASTRFHPRSFVCLPLGRGLGVGEDHERRLYDLA